MNRLTPDRRYDRGAICRDAHSKCDFRLGLRPVYVLLMAQGAPDVRRRIVAGSGVTARKRAPPAPGAPRASITGTAGDTAHSCPARLRRVRLS